MKTKNLHAELLKAFQITDWKSFERLVQESKHAYPVKMSWKCIAKGKARNGHECIVGAALQDDPNVTGHYVTEEFTYVRFAGSDIIYRYQNSSEMKEELAGFDELHVTEWEDGDVVTLEPVGMARSREYATDRRNAIKEGMHTVKPRGPNAKMRREPRRHFRPF